MSVQHPNLKAELLYLIGRATAPMSSADLYEKCELADEIVQVSKAISNLVADGKVVRVEGEGRARYALAAGVAAPAPAGKAGRSKAVQADDAKSGQLLTSARPLDIPTLADPGVGLQGAAGKTQRARPAKPEADHIAGAGNMVHLPDQTASAERMADGMLAKARAQLSAEIAPRWWIDQNGGVEIACGDDMVRLNRQQAARIALVVLAVHDEMESPA